MKSQVKASPENNPEQSFQKPTRVIITDTEVNEELIRREKAFKKA